MSLALLYRQNLGAAVGATVQASPPPSDFARAAGLGFVCAALIGSAAPCTPVQAGNAQAPQSLGTVGSGFYQSAVPCASPLGTVVLAAPPGSDVVSLPPPRVWPAQQPALIAGPGLLGAFVGAPAQQLPAQSMVPWSAPLRANTGLLGAFARAATSELQEVAQSQFWSPVVAVGDPIMATGPVPPFTAAWPTEAAHPRLAGAAVVFAAVVSGSTASPGEHTFGAHSVAIYNAEAAKTQVWASVPASGGGSRAEYRFGAHAVAIYNAEAQKTQVWQAVQAGTPLGHVLGAEYVFGVHASALYSAEAEKTQVWQSVVGYTAPIGILGSFVGAAPQLLDLTVPAQVWTPTFSPQGYIFPQAEADPQEYRDPQPYVAGSAWSVPIQSLRSYVAAPQAVDLTLQPQVTVAAQAPQGSLVAPALYAAPQANEAAAGRGYVSAAAPGHQGPTVGSFVTPPQAFDPTLPALSVRPARTSGTASRFVAAAPQPLDLTVPAFVARAVQNPGGPTVRSFATPPQQVDLTVPPQVWRAVFAAPVASRFVVAAPQSVDLTLPARVVGARPSPPAPASPVGAFVAVPQQAADLRGSGTVWPPLTVGRHVAQSYFAAPQVLASWPQGYYQPPAIFNKRGVLGGWYAAAPQVLSAWPAAYTWSSAHLGPKGALVVPFYFAAPPQVDWIRDDPWGPYFLKPIAPRQFGWMEVIALLQLGVRGVNVNVNMVMEALAQARVQGARSTFLEGSACFVNASYYDINDLGFTPAAVQYRIDDLLSETNILPWTAIAPAAMNQVTVTSAQNQMVSLTRDSEEHQVLFQVTDGYGDVNYGRVIFNLVRVVAEEA